MTSQPPANLTIRSLATERRARLALVSINAFVGSAIEALFLVLVTSIAFAVTEGLDEIALASQSIAIRPALGVAAGLVAARLLVTLHGAWQGSKLTASTALGLRERVLNDYLNASWPAQAAEPPAKLQQIVSWHTAGAAASVQHLSLSLSSAISLVALIGAAVLVSPVAALFVLIMVTVLGFVITPLRTRVRVLNRDAQRSLTEFSTRVNDTATLSLEVKSFGVGEPAFDGLMQAAREAEQGQQRSDFAKGTVVPVYTTVAYLALIGGLGIGQAVGVGELADIGAVVLLMFRSLSYGQAFNSARANLASSSAYVEMLSETLSRFDAASTPNLKTPLGPGRSLTFAGVSFAYGETPTLSSIDFSIEPGARVGLIGPSGSGKTTLIQLLLGLRQPDEGEILLGDTAIRNVGGDEWSRLVAFVPQEPRLLTGTVAENVSFYRSTIGQPEIEDACRRAHIHLDVARLPDGYATHLGERGSELSGGQRQRLSIARALAGSPKLLILDEPTSALDVEAERVVRDALGSLGSDVTVIIVAHRISTLDLCDQIMVIKDGKLDALGTRDELRETNHFFRGALELSGLQ